MLVGIIVLLAIVALTNALLIHHVILIDEAIRSLRIHVLDTAGTLERLNGHHSGLIELLNRRETINSTIQPAQPQAIQIFKGP